MRAARIVESDLFRGGNCSSIVSVINSHLQNHDETRWSKVIVLLTTSVVMCSFSALLGKLSRLYAPQLKGR